MAWRARVREFVETHILPHCDRWDVYGYPKELHTRAYAEGIAGAIFPAALGGTPPEGCAAQRGLEEERAAAHNTCVAVSRRAWACGC